MLVSLKEILADAKENRYAVGAFDCPNTVSPRLITTPTCMALAGGQAVVEKLQGITKDDPVFYHDIPMWATAAMKGNVKEAMRVFSMK
ncbi:hypothetical protein V6615_04040 [Oscillospiraceae bacterium PP1C4]